MKRRLFNVALSLGLLTIQTAYAQNVFQLSTMMNEDPVTVVSKAVMTEAYHRLGITIHAESMPAERAMISANSGVVEGELYRRDGMEKIYPNLVMIPVPIYFYELRVFSKGKSFTVNGWDSLRPYSIGIVTGVKVVEAATQGMSVESVATMEQAFTKLEKGRTDIVVSNGSSGLYIIKLLGLKGISELSPALDKFPVYHYLHKKNQHLVPKLTAVLEGMQLDGTILKLQRETLEKLALQIRNN